MVKGATVYALALPDNLCYQFLSSAAVCRHLQVARLKVLSCLSACSHVLHPLRCAPHCQPTQTCWLSSAATQYTGPTMSSSFAPWTPPMCVKEQCAWCTPLVDPRR